MKEGEESPIIRHMGPPPEKRSMEIKGLKEELAKARWSRKPRDDLLNTTNEP
jgi:hypothetical protein